MVKRFTGGRCCCIIHDCFPTSDTNVNTWLLSTRTHQHTTALHQQTPTQDCSPPAYTKMRLLSNSRHLLPQFSTSRHQNTTYLYQQTPTYDCFHQQTPTNDCSAPADTNKRLFSTCRYQHMNDSLQVMHNSSQFNIIDSGWKGSEGACWPCYNGGEVWC